MSGGNRGCCVRKSGRNGHGVPGVSTIQGFSFRASVALSPLAWGFPTFFDIAAVLGFHFSVDPLTRAWAFSGVLGCSPPEYVRSRLLCGGRVWSGR